MIFRFDAENFFDEDLKCDDVDQICSKVFKEEAKDESDAHDESDTEDDSETDEFHDCVDTFDIDVEPTFVMPYSVGQDADPACVSMDRLIREGKLSTDSFFYKNFSEVVKHLQDPNKKWDPIICEALMSIRHLGGMATMNHVIGPLRTGYGRKGCKDVSPILNYGGPSHFVLSKYVPGIMPISGISKHNLLSAQTLLKLSDVRSCHPAVEVFSVALQMDGTMVKAGLRWDSNLGFAVGCKDPLTFQDLKEKDFILDGDFLKRNLVCEVDVCVLVSLDSNVCLSLGYILQSASGKSGPEIIQKYSEVIKTVSKCENCVRAKAPHLNTLPPDTPCCSVCLVCWNQAELCNECRLLGRRTIYPQLEPCFQCLEKGVKCKKVLVQVLALDCFSGNRCLIEKFQTDLEKGARDPELYFTEPLGEIIHILKTIKSSFSNWFLLGVDGNIFTLAMLRTLRDDNLEKEVVTALKQVLQKGSVVNRDRQDTDCLVEFNLAVPVIRNVAEIDPIVVHQICPEKFKLEPTNKQGSLGPVSYLGAVNIGQVAVITNGKDDAKSFLSILDLHSPVRIKLSMEVARVTGFVAMEAVIVISVDGGLRFVEVVKGSVIPKIPTKKADLIALCTQMKLAAGGTAKDLRSRLVKKLKPSKRTELQDIILCPNLRDHFGKSTNICLLAVKNNLPDSLIEVDMELKRVFTVKISYEEGEVHARLANALDFPPNLEAVETVLATPDVIICCSLKQMILLDHFLNVMRIIDLEFPVVSMCVKEEKLAFLQEDKVWEESMQNLKKGIFNAKHVARSGKGPSKDGSGRSSRLGGSTALACYQKSLLIGTTSGKVKVISDIHSIADFLESTFSQGVRGFGLHKKNGERNAGADLDSCKSAHESIGDYLEKTIDNIRDSFKYQVPAKLNGPQHSVSAVTVSTVKLAAKSFAKISEDLKHVSSDGEDLSNKVNPDSTTTKAVEHFHSLAHRKAIVQTVHEYIQSWSVIVREMVKSLCSWPFKMFSGYKSSYYLRPDNCRIPLEDVPMIPKLLNMNRLSKDDDNKAKEVCQEYKALPQSSTRAFTSKFKAGTLPLQAYLVTEPETGDDSIDQNLETEDLVVENSDTGEGSTSEDGYIDEPQEWDSASSDGEDVVVDSDSDDGTYGGMFTSVNQNRVTRSGRRVVAPKHFMYDGDSGISYTIYNAKF